MTVNEPPSSDLAKTPRIRLRDAVIVALRTAVKAIAVLVLLFVGGFFWFTAEIGRVRLPETPQADGIVAFTGGADRLADAFDLLAKGKAERLLISGVYTGTTREQLAKLHPKAARYIYCCVDLDREALNTVGNALETNRWVRKMGYTKIIVVTSSWHMPRALIEVARRLPDVELIPHPVIYGEAGPGEWWRSGAAFRLLAKEYIKYLGAKGNQFIIANS